MNIWPLISRFSIDKVQLLPELWGGSWLDDPPVSLGVIEVQALRAWAKNSRILLIAAGIFPVYLIYSKGRIEPLNTYH